MASTRATIRCSIRSLSTFCDNAEDAQDCLHDALIRVWTKRVTYDVARGTLRSFLVVCVRNQAISQQRTATRLAKLSTKVGAESIRGEEFRGRRLR